MRGSHGKPEGLCSGISAEWWEIRGAGGAWFLLSEPGERKERFTAVRRGEELPEFFLEKACEHGYVGIGGRPLWVCTGLGG